MRGTVFRKVRDDGGGKGGVADLQGSILLRGSKGLRVMGGRTLEKWGEVSTCVA